MTADCPELASRVVQAQDRQRVREHQQKNLERRKRVAKIKERWRLLESGPEGDAEMITWGERRDKAEKAEVAERMGKARTAREVVDKAQADNSRSLQAKDREKPEKPGWFAFFKQRGYKRELAGWEAGRSEIVAEGRTLEQKRDKLLRVERNVGGYTVRQVRKEMAGDDPRMSDRLKIAKQREAKRKKLEKQKERRINRDRITAKHKGRGRGRGKGQDQDQGKSQAAKDVDEWRKNLKNQDRGIDYDPFG